MLKSGIDTMHFYSSFVLSSGTLSCVWGLLDHHLNRVCWSSFMEKRPSYIIITNLVDLFHSNKLHETSDRMHRFILRAILLKRQTPASSPLSSRLRRGLAAPLFHGAVSRRWNEALMRAGAGCGSHLADHWLQRAEARLLLSSCLRRRHW